MLVKLGQRGSLCKGIQELSEKLAGRTALSRSATGNPDQKEKMEGAGFGDSACVVWCYRWSGVLDWCSRQLKTKLTKPGVKPSLGCHECEDDW
jgi:hypothetical protein